MMDWLDEAACLGHDTADFFPDGVDKSAPRQVAAAKRVCSRCPVRDRCLTWSLKIEAGHGVWGGLAEEERRSLHRREERRRAYELLKAPATSSRDSARPGPVPGS